MPYVIMAEPRWGSVLPLSRSWPREWTRVLPRACETQLDGGLPPFLLCTEQKQGENQMALRGSQALPSDASGVSVTRGFVVLSPRGSPPT